MKAIVVGVDASKYSVKAFDAAVWDAKAKGAKLVAVSILTKPLGYAGPALERHWLRQQKLLQAIHSRLAYKAGVAGVECTFITRPGKKPAEEIMREAVRQGAELIVVGSHGEGLRGRLRRLVLGSVSAEVVAKAACSVQVVR